MSVLQQGPGVSGGGEDVLEGGGHDPGHDVERVVEPDLAADDRRIGAEPPTPEAVAQDQDVGTVDAIVGRLKVAPQRRLDAEHLEVAGAHSLPVEALRLHALGERGQPGLHHRKGNERSAALDELTVGPERHAGGRPIAAHVPNRRDALGMRIRQRIQQDGFDGAEYRRDGADAQPQRDHADCGKAGAVAKTSGAVPQVGGDRLDHVLPPGAAHLLAQGRHVANLSPCRPPRILRGKSAFFERRDRLVEEVRQFVGDVLVGGRPMGEGAKAARELAPQGHAARPLS